MNMTTQHVKTGLTTAGILAILVIASLSYAEVTSPKTETVTKTLTRLETSTQTLSVNIQEVVIKTTRTETVGVEYTTSVIDNRLTTTTRFQTIVVNQTYTLTYSTNAVTTSTITTGTLTQFCTNAVNHQFYIAVLKEDGGVIDVYNGYVQNANLTISSKAYNSPETVTTSTEQFSFGLTNRMYATGAAITIFYSPQDNPNIIYSYNTKVPGYNSCGQTYVQPYVYLVAPK